MGLLSHSDLHYGTKVPTSQSKNFGMPNIKSAKILDRMLALREERSLADYCQAVGLNYENIRKCFQRKGLPDIESLAKIAEYFQIDLQWLIYGKQPTSNLNLIMAKKIRLCRISRGWSQQHMAAKLSLSPQVLELYEQGKCLFSSDLIHKCSEILEVHPSVFTDSGSLLFKNPQLKILQTTSTEKTPQISGEDFVSVPLTESAIAAGQPIIPQEHIEDYVLLHIRAAGKRTNLVASRVDGHSMEPMLHPGDIVVIDRDDKKIVKNKMFAIYHEGGLTAKYLEKKTHLIILRPINPNAEIQIIDLNENPQPIVGKIIGAWKDL
jgi:SOS-response transcriptional repressor LexA